MLYFRPCGAKGGVPPLYSERRPSPRVRARPNARGCRRGRGGADAVVQRTACFSARSGKPERAGGCLHSPRFVLDLPDDGMPALTGVVP